MTLACRAWLKSEILITLTSLFARKDKQAQNAGDPGSTPGWGVVPSWHFEGVCFHTTSIQVMYNKLDSIKNMKIDQP